MLRSLTRLASIPPPEALLWLGSSVYERVISGCSVVSDVHD